MSAFSVEVEAAKRRAELTLAAQRVEEAADEASLTALLARPKFSAGVRFVLAPDEVLARTQTHWGAQARAAAEALDNFTEPCRALMLALLHEHGGARCINVFPSPEQQHMRMPLAALMGAFLSAGRSKAQYDALEAELKQALKDNGAALRVGAVRRLQGLRQQYATLLAQAEARNLREAVDGARAHLAFLDGGLAELQEPPTPTPTPTPTPDGSGCVGIDTAKAVLDHIPRAPTRSL